MDGIILAALALLSVPILLIVILVKVCGLENKVTDLALKLTVIDFTQKHVTAAQAGFAIRSEPSRAERVPRDAEWQSLSGSGAQPQIKPSLLLCGSATLR